MIALGIIADVAGYAVVAPHFGWRRPLGWAAIAAACWPLTARAIGSHAAIAAVGRQAYEHEYQEGAFLARYPQPGAVMLFDLGAATYLSDVRVVDLDGLGTLDVALLRLHDLDWQPEVFRHLAAVHDVRVAIDLQGFRRPPEWIRVAAWEAGEEHTDFLAVDAAAAVGLARDLRAYELELPRRVVLRVFVD